MHADPVTHAAQHYDKLDSYQDRMEREEERLTRLFAFAVMSKAQHESVDFAPTVTTYKDFERVQVKRTVFDVMCETVEGDHSLMRTVFNALVLCAKRGNIEAIDAIRAMASEYGRLNAEVV